MIPDEIDSDQMGSSASKWQRELPATLRLARVPADLIGMIMARLGGPAEIDRCLPLISSPVRRLIIAYGDPAPADGLAVYELITEQNPSLHPTGWETLARRLLNIYWANPIMHDRLRAIFAQIGRDYLPTRLPHYLLRQAVPGKYNPVLLGAYYNVLGLLHHFPGTGLLRWDIPVNKGSPMCYRCSSDRVAVTFETTKRTERDSDGCEYTTSICDYHLHCHTCDYRYSWSTESTDHGS